MSLPVFSSDEVRHALLSSKNSSSCGPDGCPAKLLKLFPELCVPLTNIFNMSVQQQAIPDAWKLANVVPIYKGKGSKLDVTNYRPISLTNVFCKLMESLIRKKVVDFLDTNNLISESQSGFRSCRSTLSQLLLSKSLLVDAINDRACIDGVYTDLSKAFDSISHKKLILKLRAYGIHPNVCAWTENFLSNRKQRVIINDHMSTWLPCNSGVPQGSVLSSLLFIIYFNDLPDIIQHSKVFLYADDAKILRRIDCRMDCLLFQQDLDALAAWCSTWQLKLNISKCIHIRYGLAERPRFDYHISGILLPSSLSCKDLGVLFDSKLTFSEHCSTIINRGFARANMLLKCFHSRDRNLQINLFNTFVRPILEYNSPVWSPHLNKDINAIERVQKFFTKRLRGLKSLPYEKRLTVLKQPSLKTRRARADLILLYKILHGLVDHNLKKFFLFVSNVLTCVHNLRGHAFKLIAPKPRTDVLKFNFIYRVIMLWNVLPSNICEASSLFTFKNRLDEHLPLF
jgi:hypothetical protein